MSDKTILFRKQQDIPLTPGWYFCRVNEIIHPKETRTRRGDIYVYYRNKPVPVEVYKSWHGDLRIQVDTEAEESDLVSDYLWYGSVPEVRILP